MFLSIINKLVVSILVPALMASISPVLLVKKIIYRPTETISVAEAGIDPESVYLTAHKGVLSYAPENTIPAFEKAVEMGYYSAECDIRLTKDKKWVLSHGEDVNKRFWQFGNMSDYTLEELKTYTYKNGTSFWKFDNLKIPTLDEFLDVFVGSKTKPQIEIKTDNYDMLYTVVDKVVAKGLENQAIVISFDLEQLRVIHQLNENIELWYLVDEITDDIIDEAREVSDDIWLSANYEKNNAESIKLAIDRKIGVSFWTVNDIEAAKQLYDMGVRYIETDILCN